MSEKDFLSQFSGKDSKPESFKEEVRVPIKKEKKPIKPLWIIIPVVVLVVLLVIVYFLFFAPKIEMPDFVGQRKEDVAAWVKQQGISSQGIIFKEEYSFDYDDGQIMAQDVAPGKKVKEDVKITFVESIGADPDELIEVPDLAYMTKEEISEWIEENKLQKTKITTAYHDEVKEGEVISFEFRGVTADEFTRGSTLNIQVSKGMPPVGVVKVEDFKGKDLSYVENWAKSKKVELEVIKSFSDDVLANAVISQSIDANKTLKEKELLTIVVSKGKGILVPNFLSMNHEEVDEWLNEHEGMVKVDHIYSTKEGYVIEQDKQAGTMFGSDEKLNLTLNLGSKFYLKDVGGSVVAVGSLYSEIVDWCNNIRHTGIDAYAGSWSSPDGVYSYEHSKGKVVSISCSSHSTGEKIPCDEKLPLDVRFDVVVSKGLIYRIEDTSTLKDGTSYNTAKVVDALAGIGLPFVNNTEDRTTCDIYIDDTLFTGTLLEVYEGSRVELR